MNNLDLRYTALLQDILKNGVEKNDRTTTGTISVFGRQIRHKMSEGFPLLTTKKLHWPSVVKELIWFLQGSTNIQWLVKNDCNIWNGDAYRHFLKEQCPHDHLETKEEFIEKIKTDDDFAKKWGELGPIYGKQWRKWTTNHISQRNTGTIENGIVIDQQFIENSPVYIDQIQNLINDLVNNPDSRRLIVTAWNPAEIGQSVLPPCHYGFQCFTRELTSLERWSLCKNEIDVDDPLLLTKLDSSFIPKRSISLMWNQRSVDTFLGLPFNIASYGLLLLMIADEVNMVPEELIGNLGDTHLYKNHIEQAKEQIGRDLTMDERKSIFEERGFNYIEEFKKRPVRHPKFMYDYCNIPKRTREPYELPNVTVMDGIWSSSLGDCILENYKYHPIIKAPLSN